MIRRETISRASLGSAVTIDGLRSKSEREMAQCPPPAPTRPSSCAIVAPRSLGEQALAFVAVQRPFLRLLSFPQPERRIHAVRKSRWSSPRRTRAEKFSCSRTVRNIFVVMESTTSTRAEKVQRACTVGSSELEGDGFSRVMSNIRLGESSISLLLHPLEKGTPQPR
jgi:hypothetical protein